ncbi:MAG: type II toxin-antitoxin system VapC family toxin [Pseudomonadota bacterium]|nr:type II toxin-antitoxin system VapC family toxin [Pseudomonadota bacterium]
MIVVDTSALIAVAANEPEAAACEAVLIAHDLLLSAATLAETLIVARRKTVEDSVQVLLDSLAPEVIDVSEGLAVLAADAYARWGKGFHPARLNYGDCFSYALAELYECPLLYIGDHFVRTDIRSALG